MRGINLKRPAHVVQRLLTIAFAGVHDAAVEVGNRIVLLEANHFREIRDGRIKLTELRERCPAIETSADMRRVQLDGLALVGDGFRVAS